MRQPGRGAPAPCITAIIKAQADNTMKNTPKGGMGGKQEFPPKKDKGKEENRGGALVKPPGVNGGSAPDRHRHSRLLKGITAATKGGGWAWGGESRLYLCASRQIMSLPLSPLSAESFRTWGESRLQSARNGGAPIGATTFAPVLCSTCLQANFKAGRGFSAPTAVR